MVLILTLIGKLAEEYFKFIKSIGIYRQEKPDENILKGKMEPTLGHLLGTIFALSAARDSFLSFDAADQYVIEHADETIYSCFEQVGVFIYVQFTSEGSVQPLFNLVAVICHIVGLEFRKLLATTKF